MIRKLFFVAALGAVLNGCAATMSLSPKDEAVILLPRNSTASITGHFERSETHTYWMHQAFNRDAPTPMDVLARAAANRPVRNVTVTSSPDWLRLTLKIAGGLGAWAMLSASPTTQPLGPLAYLFVILAVPDTAHYHVQGDYAEWPNPQGGGK